MSMYFVQLRIAKGTREVIIKVCVMAQTESARHLNERHGWKAPQLELLAHVPQSEPQ